MTHVLQMKYFWETEVDENQTMAQARILEERLVAPLWIRRPALLHLVAYSLVAAVFSGQIVALLVNGSNWPTVLAVMLAGGGAALSWWRPWAGLLVTSSATFAVTAVGQDPLSIWMMAVLVLFSFALRGKQPIVGTVIVAGMFLVSYGTLGDFRGGAFAGAAALFSAIAGGATGAGLRLFREHWFTLEERAERANARREVEATQRVAEERLRIARDLHDVIGHQVAMLSVHLGVAEIGLPHDATSSRQAIESARTSARTVVMETQRILVLLRRGDAVADAEALQPTPTVDGLRALVDSFESIGLVIESSIAFRPGALEPGVEVAVYRVVQEALTNAYRHGEGITHVDVHEGHGFIEINVENQVSWPPRESDAGSRLGLIGMRERVESCGGQLAVVADEKRFRVSAQFRSASVVTA